MNERAPGEFRDGSCHLNAGRAAPDNNSRHQPCANCRIVGQLGPFKGAQESFTDFLGVSYSFEPRREGSPRIVTKIGVGRPRCDNQVIKRDRDRASGHESTFDVDPINIEHHHFDIGPAGEDASDGPSNFARREHSGRDLVEEGLEQMKISPIDDCDIDGCTRERLSGFKTTKTGANDYDLWTPSDI
jgi:hypothetical protein